MAASALQRSVRTGSCCMNARYGDGVHAYKVSVDDTVHAHTERVLSIAPHLHFQNVQTGSKLRLEEVVDDLPSLRLIVKVPVSVPVSEWGARTSLSQHQCFHACINVFSAHVHACCVGWKAASFTPAWDGRQPASHLRGMEGSQLHTSSCAVSKDSGSHSHIFAEVYAQCQLQCCEQGKALIAPHAAARRTCMQCSL
jgi:hypothetical protein